MHNNNKKRAPEVPLSEATIPSKLEDIRRRCSDLLTADGEIALCLDDNQQPGGAYNPYDRNAG